MWLVGRGRARYWDAEARLRVLGIVAAAAGFILGPQPGGAQSLQTPQARFLQLSSQARAEFQRGEFVEAERKFLELTRLAPEDSAAYHNLGLVYFEESKYSDAVVPLEKAVQLDPTAATTYMLLGRAYYMLREPEKAVAALQTALRLRPDDEEVLRFLGLSEVQAGEYDSASETLAKTAQSAPDSDVLQNLSLAYMKQVVQGLNRQGNYPPHSYEASMLAALDAEGSKNYRAAAECYRDALRAKPDALGVHAALAMALVRIAKFDEGIAEFKKELELNPNDALTLRRLGRLIADTHGEGALGYLERAASLDPQNSKTRLAYAHALLRKGETEKAVEQFRRAEELDPESAPVHYQLANIYRRQGRKEEAQAELRRFEDLSKQKSEESLEHARKALATKGFALESEQLAPDSPPARNSASGSPN